MARKLQILANGKPLALPTDFDISIEESNPYFNGNEMFSYPVQMPLWGNRHLLGNIDDPNSSLRPVALEHTKMQIFSDGMPFRSGTLVTSDDEEVGDTLTMSISAAANSIDDLISDMQCRDVPLKDKILIGEKIGNVNASVSYKYHVKVTYDGKKPDKDVYPNAYDNATQNFSPQALGFSFPGECYTTTNDAAQSNGTITYSNGNKRIQPKVKTSYINVSDPYPTKYYCNARVAYKHRGLKDGKTSDELNPVSDKSGPENHWPYWVLDADRPQSGICFYVLYFLDCLFAHLGLSFDNSELLKVEDMRRLCFFTTHCKYTEEKKYSTSPYFNSLTTINKWLSSRGCGGQFEFTDGDDLSVNDVDYTDASGKRWVAKVGTDGVTAINAYAENITHKITADVMLMYATSDNFPEESVKTVLDSLENSFGIKFHYDYEKKHVKAIFIRDVFRNQEEPIEFPGAVTEMVKVTEKVTGVRMCYSEESSSKEQQENIKKGTRDYNTDYDYVEYPQDRTVTDKTYNEIYRTPSMNGGSGDMKVYVDRKTGNAYRIKVNGDAEKASELKPTLFEVGQFKGVEIGDCSTINEEFVTELSSDFVPMVFSDVNIQETLKTATGTYYDSTAGTAKLNTDYDASKHVFAAFIDEDMEHEFVEQRVRQCICSNACEFYLDEVLNLVESYNPGDTEDGNSPLQEMDWGLAIAVMRGGGADALYQTYDHNYDGFGNSKWRSVAGEYALVSDSLDLMGNEYDYNGVSDGIGGGERFSLKIRAWKQPEWADAPLCDSDVKDTEGNIEKKIRSRGLFDTFMTEYAYFLLNRRKYRIRLEATAPQLADIPNQWHRRFKIGGMVGYINKLSYKLHSEFGLQDLEVEFFTV